MAENKKSQVFRIVQGLFLLNMVIWLVLGTISLAQLEKGADNPIFTVIAIMMMGNAALMGLAAWWLGRFTRWGYLFALALLVTNILTTFTDQVGLLDYATVLVDFVLLLLLILRRKEFVK